MTFKVLEEQECWPFSVSTGQSNWTRPSPCAEVCQEAASDTRPPRAVLSSPHWTPRGAGEGGSSLTWLFAAAGREKKRFSNERSTPLTGWCPRMENPHTAIRTLQLPSPHRLQSRENGALESPQNDPPRSSRGDVIAARRQEVSSWVAVPRAAPRSCV